MDRHLWFECWGTFEYKCCITAAGVECSSQLSSTCQSSWHSIPLAQCSFHHGTYHGPLRPSPKLYWARRRLGRFNLWPPMVPTVLLLTSYSKVLAFHSPRWLMVKETGSRDIIQIIRQKWLPIGINKNFYWFLNFQNAPLMRCRHCQFPRILSENMWEK
jgi:hypothetical protein